jgi:hypothetical protein
MHPLVAGGSADPELVGDVGDGLAVISTDVVDNV